MVILSCKKEIKETRDVNRSPLVIVVKFITAESFLDTIEAKKYIDIESVYGRFIDKENSSAFKAWESKLMFGHNLSKDKKFTNHFDFYNYDFNEAIDNDKASVLFTSNDKGSSIESIEYVLKLNSGKWRIVDIKPKKRQVVTK